MKDFKSRLIGSGTTIMPIPGVGVVSLNTDKVWLVGDPKPSGFSPPPTTPVVFSIETTSEFLKRCHDAGFLKKFDKEPIFP